METTVKKCMPLTSWFVRWLYIQEKCLGMNCRHVEYRKGNLPE